MAQAFSGNQPGLPPMYSRRASRCFSTKSPYASACIVRTAAKVSFSHHRDLPETDNIPCRRGRRLQDSSILISFQVALVPNSFPFSSSQVSRVQLRDTWLSCSPRCPYHSLSKLLRARTRPPTGVLVLYPLQQLNHKYPLPTFYLLNLTKCKTLWCIRGGNRDLRT